MEKNNNEIDLIDLIKDIKLKAYRFFIRRFKILIISLILGFIGGVFHFIINKNTYQNTVIATSQILPSSLVVEMINNFNDFLLLENKNIKATDEDNLNKLISIMADTMETSKSLNGEVIKPFHIVLVFKSGFKQKDFLQFLINYVDSNTYVKNEKELENQRSLFLIEKYSREINKLDSLQKKILNSNLQNTKSELGNLIVLNDKVNNFFHNDIINLEASKLHYLIKLKKLSGLTIIDSKNYAQNQVNSITGSVIKMVMYFFLLGILIAFILDYRSQMKLLIKEDDTKLNEHNIEPS